MLVTYEKAEILQTHTVMSSVATSGEQEAYRFMLEDEDNANWAARERYRHNYIDVKVALERFEPTGDTHELEVTFQVPSEDDVERLINQAYEDEALIGLVKTPATDATLEEHRRAVRTALELDSLALSPVTRTIRLAREDGKWKIETGAVQRAERWRRLKKAARLEQDWAPREALTIFETLAKEDPGFRLPRHYDRTRPTVAARVEELEAAVADKKRQDAYRTFLEFKEVDLKQGDGSYEANFRLANNGTRNITDLEVELVLKRGDTIVQRTSLEGSRTPLEAGKEIAWNMGGMGMGDKAPRAPEDGEVLEVILKKFSFQK